MSADGAHLGVSADRALETILGGAPEPTDEEKMSAGEMRDWLLSATEEHAMDSYGECARYTAKLVLELLLAHPEEASSGHDLYELIPALKPLGITGFQWGWAENAARRCLELPPVANPAIVTIGDA